MTLYDFDDYRFDTMYAARMDGYTPYEVASKDEIISFVETNMIDEVEEELEESPYWTKEQAIGWIIDHHEDEVAERYNEYYKDEHWN